MSQLSKMTLDGVEFFPVRVDANGVASLRTRGDSVNDAKTVSLQVRPSKTSGATKVTGKLAIPYWFSPKGDSTKKARETERCDVTVVLPPNASLAHRQDIYKKLVALVGSPQFKDAVENLESLF